jgi:hypothetical protein
MLRRSPSSSSHAAASAAAVAAVASRRGRARARGVALPPLVTLAAVLALVALGDAGCDETPAVPDEPSIAAVVPNAAAPGAAVELRGAGFGIDAAVTRVLFGGVEAAIDASLYSDGYVTVAVPAVDPGTVALVIEVDGVVSNGVFFTVQP